MTTAKKATAYRLSSTAKKLIEALAADMGLTQTAVIEVAVRDLAKNRKIEIEEAATEAKTTVGKELMLTAKVIVQTQHGLETPTVPIDLRATGEDQDEVIGW